MFPLSSMPLTRRGALAGLAALAGCGPTRLAPLAGPPRGRVLLLRGLANFFSTGLNVLTQRLRAAGFDARVHNHVEWRRLAAETIAEDRAGTLPRPLVVIGHSFGADDAIDLVGRLGAAGVATDLLVTFDPQWRHEAPRGVRLVVNFHQLSDPFERRIAPSPGFDCRIENRVVEDVSHLTIEKSERLHDQVLELMQGLAAPAAPAAPPVATRLSAARLVARQERLPLPPRPVRAGG